MSQHIDSVASDTGKNAARPSKLGEVLKFDIPHVKDLETLTSPGGTVDGNTRISGDNSLFTKCFPLFNNYLDCHGLVSTMLVSKSIQHLYDSRVHSDATHYNAFCRRFTNIEVDKFESSNATTLVRDFVEFLRKTRSVLESVGATNSLRVDLLFELAPFFERHFEWETLIYQLSRGLRGSIATPQFCILLAQYANRGKPKMSSSSSADSDSLGGSAAPDLLQLTVHEYRWGAQTPRGYRSRDVEVITEYHLSPCGPKVEAADGGEVYLDFECVSGEESIFDKLDRMRAAKKKGASLMQCLTPSVIWIGGQRRADVARGRGLSV
jgi:hypothetical protein